MPGSDSPPRSVQRPKVIPALSDLTQDIAGPVPVRLLHDWATGEQDPAAAEALLQPFEIEGTVVSTDTSGLSRLTQSMDLLDTLSLISQPKEIVHALGRAIGGRAIGTWVADNTEMFYPAEVEPDLVVDAMSEVQYRIHQRLRLRIGMCLHPGRYYDIGGGLYGVEADRVETLAENCAGPEEILLTDEMVGRLKNVGASDLTLKEFPADGARAWLLGGQRRLPELRESETLYPHPFPQDFYALLPHFFDPEDQAAVKQRIYDEWLRERIVVFLALAHYRPEATVTGLVNELVTKALMATVVGGTLRPEGHLASSGGGIAILTFEHSAEALDYVRAAHEEFARNGLFVCAGIDAGPVLLFPKYGSGSGITGDPVNIASKLAEELGQPGRTCITNRASARLPGGKTHDPFEVKISGITLKGVTLD